MHSAHLLRRATEELPANGRGGFTLFPDAARVRFRGGVEGATLR
jgi:hypothetical protein